MDCLECGKYIKFISDKELDAISPGWEKEVKFKEETETPSSTVTHWVKKKKSIRLAEMDFKLDLILDHLGIKNSPELRKMHWKGNDT